MTVYVAFMVDGENGTVEMADDTQAPEETYIIETNVRMDRTQAQELCRDVIKFVRRQGTAAAESQRMARTGLYE